MKSTQQNPWNRSSTKDTFLNATLVSVALMVVVAQAVVSGEVEGQAPRHEAVASAAPQSDSAFISL